MGQPNALPVQYASNAALAAQLGGLPPNWLLSIAAAKQQQAAIPFLQQAAAAGAAPRYDRVATSTMMGGIF
jgi:hypothetical protein